MSYKECSKNYDFALNKLLPGSFPIFFPHWYSVGPAKSDSTALAIMLRRQHIFYSLIDPLLQNRIACKSVKSLLPPLFITYLNTLHLPYFVISLTRGRGQHKT